MNVGRMLSAMVAAVAPSSKGGPAITSFVLWLFQNLYVFLIDSIHNDAFKMFLLLKIRDAWQPNRYDRNEILYFIVAAKYI